jgi:hypothetical protein
MNLGAPAKITIRELRSGGQACMQPPEFSSFIVLSSPSPNQSHSSAGAAAATANENNIALQQPSQKHSINHT